MIFPLIATPILNNGVSTFFLRRIVALCTPFRQSRYVGGKINHLLLRNTRALLSNKVPLLRNTWPLFEKR